MRLAFAPVTRLSVSEWADRYGWIARGAGASEPGPYSTERAPYLRDILDTMGDEIHTDVVLNKPAQVGFTEAINQFIGYCMAEDPSGVIVIHSDIERARDWMKERIDPMLAESPRLQGVVRSENGRRTSDDTMQRKVYAGGYLAAVGANSPAGLRSRPSRRAIGDERSGWKLDARQQGDPWDLVGERTSTFWNAKRIQGSTPGEEGTCAITKALHESDWRKWVVECPQCGFGEPFQWKTEEGAYRIVCERGAANELIPATARYLCTACGILIPEYEKPRMNRSGRWVASQPDKHAAGFDLGNSLMSPWRSWEKIMQKWVEIQGNHERLKSFVTHVLAEPWKVVAERIEVHTLMQRVEPFGPVTMESGETVVRPFPETVALTTGSLDVQNNRLEALTVGWAAAEEAFVFEWLQHDGDPTQDQVWADALGAFTRNTGAPLRAIAVDTQYLTEEVWKRITQWSQMLPGVRIFGIKGMDGRPRPIMGRPAASSAKRAHRAWLVGVDVCKDALALRLRQPVPPGGPGAVHFSDTLASAFFDGLTSEEQRTAIVNGRPTKVWRLRANMRNEPLDLFNYALAALHGLGPSVLVSLGQMAEERAKKTAEAAANVPAVDSPAGIQVPRTLPQPQRSGWVSGAVPRRRW